MQPRGRQFIAEHLSGDTSNPLEVTHIAGGISDDGFSIVGDTKKSVNFELTELEIEPFGKTKALLSAPVTFNVEEGEKVTHILLLNTNEDLLRTYSVGEIEPTGETVRIEVTVEEIELPISN